VPAAARGGSTSTPTAHAPPARRGISKAS
jgi:hypothetical protein